MQENVKIKDDVIESILGHIPSDLQFKVDLPSKGKFYTGFNQVKGVTVRPINFEDELALANHRSETNFDPIGFLIERCVTGLKIDEMLVMDRFSILLKLREVSYGNEYKTTVICQKCNTENSLPFKINELPVSYVPEDLKEPVKLKLPILGKEVTIKFPRKQELDLIGNDSLGNNLWRFIESFDGMEDKSVIAKLLKDQRFPVKDVKAILSVIQSVDYGIQTRAEFICCNDKCKALGQAELELGADFFS